MKGIDHHPHHLALPAPRLGETIYKMPGPKWSREISQVPCQGSEAITINVTRRCALMG